MNLMEEQFNTYGWQPTSFLKNKGGKKLDCNRSSTAESQLRQK